MEAWAGASITNLVETGQIGTLSGESAGAEQFYVIRTPGMTNPGGATIRC
jgi:hypothetical protein